MFLCTVFAAGRWRGRGAALEEAGLRVGMQEGGSANVANVDTVASVLLGTICVTFLWLDYSWSRHFVKRVGNVCNGRAGDLFNFSFVCMGVCLAQRVL